MSEVRLRKVESLLKHEISDLLAKSVVKDPRIHPMTAVTDVSRDLHYAKVYVSFFGEEAERRGSAGALNHAAGFIQRELGKRLRLRFIPKLTFYPDNSIERGVRVTQKIREIFS
jgi:ribosome-binding factor A